MTGRELRSVGDLAVLAACEGEDPAGLAAAVRAAGLDGVVDVVPAAATVLVTVGHPRHRPALDSALRRLAPLDVDPGGEAVVLPVTYDGADLAAVAAATGLAGAEVVARHQGGDYRVAFCGFAPGFAYLTGLDPALHLPRRAEPRTRVPAGAVAVAGPYTAAYPRPSPGGWHLLGTTTAVLWDPAADPPGRLVPGARVRFEPA